MRRTNWVHRESRRHRQANASGEQKDLAYAIEARRRARRERDEQERTRRCPRGKAQCHQPPVRAERVAADHGARRIEIALEEMDDRQREEGESGRSDDRASRKHDAMIREGIPAGRTLTADDVQRRLCPIRTSSTARKR